MSQLDFNREIQRLFKSAMDETYYSSEGIDVVNSDTNQSTHEEFEQFYMLTISSQEFRVLTLIHLNHDDQSRAYVAQKLNATSESLGDERFYDFIGELGNTLCGSIKRGINAFIPSLGMSTPNRLEAGSMKYMLSQRPSYEAHQHVEINGQTLFQCSVYVCNKEELNYEIKPVSFAAEEIEDTECGELELF